MIGFIDHGYHGLPFTWDNRHEAGSNVKEQLDQALGGKKFMMEMGASEVYHIPLVESDHASLLVEVRRRDPAARRDKRKPKPFRYENMW